MRLQEQAAEAGGWCDSLLGNHEILALGMYRFGDTEVPSDFGPRSFARSWEINGGQRSDQEALTDEHIELADRAPAAGGRRGLPADALRHARVPRMGRDVEEINENVARCWPVTTSPSGGRCGAG